jgi:hypothetical protein
LSLDFSRGLADGPSSANEKDIMSYQSFHSSYFPKLSELGLRIFLSSKRYQSTVAANQDQTTYISQVVEDMVNLSGEVINLLRQCLPSLALVTGFSAETSSSMHSRKDSHPRGKDEGSFAASSKE